jgi:hypothetical protein
MLEVLPYGIYIHVYVNKHLNICIYKHTHMYVYIGMLEVLPYGSSKGEGVAILLKHIGNLHI